MPINHLGWRPGGPSEVGSGQAERLNLVKSIRPFRVTRSVEEAVCLVKGSIILNPTQ